MKRLFSFLMVAALVVSMLTATAFAAGGTATLTVTGLEGDIHTGDTVTVTITITGDNGQKMSGATVDITATGLEYVSSKGAALLGVLVSAGKNACTAATDSNHLQESLSWTYTYKVTAAAGETVSITTSTSANEGKDAQNKYPAITVKEAPATATVKAAEPTPTVDKTALNAAIADAEKVDESKYTADSVAALKTALEAAKAVAAKADATKAEVDAAAKALTDAKAALVEKATEPTTKPTQPTQPSGPDLDRPSGWQPGQSLVPSGTTAPTTTPEKDEVPKTADATTQVWPLAVMMVLSAAGVAVLVRKRNGK